MMSEILNQYQVRFYNRLGVGKTLSTVNTWLSAYITDYYKLSDVNQLLADIEAVLMEIIYPYGGSSFKLIGGHTSHNLVRVESLTDITNNTPLNKLLIIDPNTSGLPINMQIYKSNPHPNGHIIHENVFYIDNSKIANGTNTYEFGGKVFKRKAKHTEINPSWSTDKIKEEHAFALAKKKASKIMPPEPQRFGETKPYLVKFYKSLFSDGTPILIKEANYEWQNGKKYYNYITYIEIQ